MQTNKARRKRQLKSQALSDAWRYFLETGDYCLEDKTLDVSPRDKFYIFQCGNPRLGGASWRKLHAVWMSHKAEVLREWKVKKKIGRPWAETVFSERKEV